MASKLAVKWRREQLKELGLAALADVPLFEPGRTFLSAGDLYEVGDDGKVRLKEELLNSWSDRQRRGGC